MKRPSHNPLRRKALCAALVLATVLAGGLPLTAHAAPGDITTVAGTGSFVGGTSGGDGDGGPALAANIPPPYGVATAAGRYYFSQNGSGADLNRVRMVQNGTINTFAGGVTPPLADGVSATQAYLPAPPAVISDPHGNLYIADDVRVRKVDATTGIITTFAGCPANLTCPSVPGGDGGPATQALIAGAHSLALDTHGNLFIGSIDYSNGSTVRKVDATTGVITTVAGGGNPADGLGDNGPATGAQITPFGLAVNAAGDIYIGDQDRHRARRVDAATGIITTVAGDGSGDFGGDGGPATAAHLLYPGGVSLDAAGNLYIADSGNGRIRKVDLTGTISTFAGSGPGLEQDCRYSGDGGPATSATMCEPLGVTVDPAGLVYIADSGDYRVRKVDASGTITTVTGTGAVGFSGDGGPAAAATIDATSETAVDPGGNLLIADAGSNRIRDVDHTTATITTVAGGGIGDGLAATSAMLNSPRGLVVDAAGNLLIADCRDNRVRKVDSSGVITSIAGTAASHGVGDGGPATAAGLGCPDGLGLDSAHNLYIADSTDNRVRRVDASGVITSVAGTGTAGFSGDGGPATSAQLNRPSGVLVDSAGNLFIADRNNNRVRKVDTTGRITTIAGNGNAGASVDGVAATSVPVVWPVGVAIGPGGNLAIAESGFARVRSVDAKGIISTIAGNGIPGYSGDGGPGPLATLDEPTGIAYDAGGNLLIADNQNLAVRSVAAGTPPPPPPVTKKTANCGMTVTQNLTLADDIGPCPGDGVIIGADGVHLNLNGHTISGSFGHSGSSVGVRVTGHQKVKVSDGTVTGFDAGVALISSSGNTVTGLTVANNQGNPLPFNSVFGDGIVMFFSANNTVAGNTVTNNGPFDGIAMLGQGADSNLIQNNSVRDTTNFDQPFYPALGLGIVTNPFLGFDRPRQVSVYANQIVGNTVIANGSAGISTISNINGVVRSNLVERNGFQSPFGGAFPGNGIGVQNVRNGTTNTNELVEFNQVIGNGRNGIEVFSNGNTILDNTGTGNGAGPFRGYDFTDSNRVPGTYQPTCSTNIWTGNVWGTGGFYPQCASNGGHQLPGTATMPMPMMPPIPQGLGDPPPRQAPS